MYDAKALMQANIAEVELAAARHVSIHTNTRVIRMNPWNENE